MFVDGDQTKDIAPAERNDIPLPEERATVLLRGVYKHFAPNGAGFDKHSANELSYFTHLSRALV